MEILVIWLLCPIAAAAIASAKGRSGFGWLLLGLLIGIFAVLIVACLPSRKPREFVMAHPDGTVSRIMPAPPPVPARGPDYHLFDKTFVVVGGIVAITIALAMLIGG